MTKYHRNHKLVSLLLLLLVLVGGSWCCAAEESATAIVCRTGWTTGATGSEEKAIPNDWINDGYCDCPFDGKDEPDTNACSGSLFWPGVYSTSDSSDTAIADYVCPISNKVVPISRLHDGICDCCDGSDEDPKHDANHQARHQQTTNPCPNNCQEILRAERERKAKIRNNFEIGSKKRDRDLAKFAEFRTQKVAEVKEMEQKLAAIETELEDIEGRKIPEMKQSYVTSRVATMKDAVVGGTMGRALLTGLAMEELEALIVSICQIAGEIFKSEQREADKSDDTCLPLRVAALDLGLELYSEDGSTSVWAAEDLDIELLFSNAIDTKASDTPDVPLLRYDMKSKTKTKSPRKGGRRLGMYYPEDDYFPVDDGDDDYEDVVGHDDDDDSIHGRDGEEENSQEKKDSPETNIRMKFMEEIQTTMFSVKRARFMNKSQEMLDEIETVFNPPEDAPKVSFDRDKYEPFQKSLEEKRTIVELGYSWGASAKMLLTASPPEESSMTKKEMLERLVIGTIFYGQISAVQVWQMLQTVLPEYQILSKAFESELGETTCHSPWAGNCPPRHVNREHPGGNKDLELQYPPQFLLEVATSFCDEEASNFGKTFASCPKNDDGNTNIHDIIQFLATLDSSHHLFGYTVPTRRDPKIDPFESMFRPISSLDVDSDGLKFLEETRDKRKGEQKELKKSIDSGWKEVGGVDGTALGIGGELYAIKDECFEIVSGKYTYELCLFDKAQQKEGSKKSGTSLGNFKAIEYKDDDSGAEASRMLLWENGQRCWNGPKRSATIYMTCGPDQKVVSADEPDTCKYVFEMVSYMACDEAYKLKMGF